MMAKLETFAESAREGKKKIRTRARLMDAAVTVIARSGLDLASVQDIAIEAEVANGTFYSHFRDKEEIVAAISHGIATDLARHMDEGSVDFKDAAHRVAYATQRFIQIAVSQPKWGWLYIHTFYHPKAVKRTSKRHIERDIKLGIEQKRFSVVPDEYLLNVILVIIKLAIHTQLTKSRKSGEALTATAAILRVLGMPADEAEAISRRASPGELDDAR
jgi:AcrR family transcriptional regulator